MTRDQRRQREDALTKASDSSTTFQLDSRNFALTLKYRPIIFAEYLAPNVLLVVEEPWLKIMQKLPDPIFRQRYGT